LDTISTLSARLDSRDVTAGALLDASLDIIARQDGDIRAFISIMEESARRQAQAADTRAREGQRLGPLDGIPISVKDIVATRDDRRRCTADQAAGSGRRGDRRQEQHA